MATKKQAPTAKKAAGKEASAGKNMSKLTAAGVVPENYKRFSPTEKEAIESLSPAEVRAMISTRTKFGSKFFTKHASHGMLY